MLTASLPPQQAAHRARELERVYQERAARQVQPAPRGHHAQLSISDDNYHATEVIGDMYGDYIQPPSEPQRSPARPLSFVPSLGDTLESGRRQNPEHARSPLNRTPPHEQGRPVPIMSNDRPPMLPLQLSPKFDLSPTGSIASINGHNAAQNGQISPPALNRTPSEPSQQHFPLTDLDSTAAVAQELSNLQAIRRMSMDVHAADPDLPSFNSGWNVPPVAPSSHGDEEDPSRLFWVPASVHPELAPKAFETFIQDRVKTIKRSSLGQDALSPDMIPGAGTFGGKGGSLSRKKSMLSHQVKDSYGYEDGAERLGRQKSIGDRRQEQRMVSLQELEELAHDPSTLARRLSVDSSKRNSYESGNEVLSQGEDTPILAPKPAGQTLKRSTRTTYRRGSQRKSNAVSSRRQTLRGGEYDDAPMPKTDEEIPQLPALPDLSKFGSPEFGGLSRVKTEPLPAPKPVENFSRPGRRARTPPTQSAEFPSEFSTRKGPADIFAEGGRALDARSPTPEERATPVSPPPEHQTFHSRLATNGRSTASMPPNAIPVPTIIETPPPSSERERPHSSPQMLLRPERPERSSSMDIPPTQPPQGPLPNRPAAQRPQLGRGGSLQQQQPSQPQQVHPQQQMRDAQGRQRNPSLEQMASHPSPLPGGSTRTDSLSFIPTYAEDSKKVDKKGKDKKDDGSRKTSWGWLLGGEEKQKKEEEAKKKSAAKIQRPQEKGHDNTRLDLLQSSIDGNKARESLVLDRQTIQIDKGPGRKTPTETKKEKESGLFSSIFGGGKKKGDKESSGKKGGSSLRGLSPDPPQKRLQPDVDYNWSRFSILEERAIYRMAHIKLANPRRELYSQVLLSNFMYSYLAKVQQMHPQIQIPQSAAQKQQQRQAQQQKKAEAQKQQEQQRSQQQQGEEFAQHQRYQEAQPDTPSNTAGLSTSSARTASPSPEPPPAEDQQQQQQQHYSRPDSRASQYSQHHSSGYGNSNGSPYTASNGPSYLTAPDDRAGAGQQQYQQSHHQQQQWEYDDNNRNHGGGGNHGSKNMW